MLLREAHIERQNGKWQIYLVSLCTLIYYLCLTFLCNVTSVILRDALTQSTLERKPKLIFCLKESLCDLIILCSFAVSLVSRLFHVIHCVEFIWTVFLRDYLPKRESPPVRVEGWYWVRLQGVDWCHSNCKVLTFFLRLASCPFTSKVVKSHILNSTKCVIKHKDI